MKRKFFPLTGDTPPYLHRAYFAFRASNCYREGFLSGQMNSVAVMLCISHGRLYVAGMRLCVYNYEWLQAFGGIHKEKNRLPNAGASFGLLFKNLSERGINQIFGLFKQLST